MKRGYNIILLLCFVAGIGCRKPYDPPAIASPAGYLVVEGVINAGADSTIIKLSHTVNISSTITANPVSGAIVSVQSDQNVSFPLTDAGGGNYVSPGLNLNPAHKYRLNIKTPDGKTYQSDAEPVMLTPPIDSIGYNIISVPDTGVQIYANLHNADSGTPYYRFDYTENWEFYSKYSTLYIGNGSAIVLRTPDQLDTYCYTSDVSSDIVLASSAKLQHNVLYQSPIVSIASTSEKIEDRYSILLRAYALTADAYNFWVELKQNTEQLGSIFDAQPSQAPSNIHCLSNPSEPVAGYVSVCTVSSKRAFIYNSNLPAWVPTYPYQCALDTVGRQGPGFLFPQPNDFIPLTSNLGGGTRYTSDVCADCTVRGTKTPPPFWK